MNISRQELDNLIITISSLAFDMDSPMPVGLRESLLDTTEQLVNAAAAERMTSLVVWERELRLEVDTYTKDVEALRRFVRRIGTDLYSKDGRLINEVDVMEQELTRATVMMAAVRFVLEQTMGNFMDFLFPPEGQ